MATVSYLLDGSMRGHSSVSWLIRSLIKGVKKPDKIGQQFHRHLSRRCHASSTFASSSSLFQGTKFLKNESRQKCVNLHNVGGNNDDIIFRQLLDYKSFTYSYLLADKKSREAIIIDPVIDMVLRDTRVIKELNLNLVYGVNTHVHADHITGTGKLKELLPTCKSIISEYSKAKADITVKDKDKIHFGKFELEVRSTPGHTDGCLTYVWHEKGIVFTGDALLIRGCGRTDFQQGDSSRLYDSVHNQIYTLPHDFYVYPAHDYTGQTASTVGEEIKFNPRLSKPRGEFIKIMEQLNLPYPKQIDKALPANMVCGIY